MSAQPLRLTTIDQRPTTPYPSTHFQQDLGEMVASYMACADLVGRLHVMQVFKRRTGQDVRMNPLIPLSAAPLATFTGFADTVVLGFESVPFTRAVDRIRNLTSFTRVAFDALKRRYQQQAFTVAGTSDVALIEKIQKALIDVMQSGGTLRDFEQKVNQLTSDAGVEDLAAFQLSTVFQTNVMRAYQNGKFEQMRDPAVTTALPFWMYRTAGDLRVRPAHAALDGFAAKWDDPVWRRLYPPTGFNCRCTVTAEGPDDVGEEASQPGLDRIPPAAASVPDAGFGGLQ